MGMEIEIKQYSTRVYFFPLCCIVYITISFIPWSFLPWQYSEHIDLCIYVHSYNSIIRKKKPSYEFQSADYFHELSSISQTLVFSWTKANWRYYLSNQLIFSVSDEHYQLPKSEGQNPGHNSLFCPIFFLLWQNTYNITYSIWSIFKCTAQSYYIHS